MAKLTIWKAGEEQIYTFAPGIKVSEALQTAGLYQQQPCGGRGVCGKCRVALSGKVSPPNALEQSAGFRLACQAVLQGDAQVVLGEDRPMEQIEMAQGYQPEALRPMGGELGAAVDIGTTTIALQLYDLKTGMLLAQTAIRNPQASIAADVMGRIGAAMQGNAGTLQEQVLYALTLLLEQACQNAEKSPLEVSSAVITGNTTMLYLLTGRDPECLSHFPFQADTLFDAEAQLLGRQCYLPPCMNAFVGADITCAVLHSGMCDDHRTSLLCDIGTNGEIALWKGGKLYVTSTAAGPAFEGAGISCGCGSIAGAVDRVWIENGLIRAHTIGEAPAVGICGSGLIDAVAAFLELELVDETGATEEDRLSVAGEAALLPKDIRSVQLAKAAIAAGIATVLEAAEVSVEEVGRVYIAGGFGNHLNISSAAAIGLIPAIWQDRVTAIGNAALAGAARLLLDRQQWEAARMLAENSEHLNLGGNPVFNEHYMEEMFFPEK